MYGREWGLHTCPPMILPSSRGTAAVTHTRTHKGRVQFFKSRRLWVCLPVFMSFYQQLQPSAAEPVVSWCQVNDQRTLGNTAAYIYTPAALWCAAHPPCITWSVSVGTHLPVGNRRLARSTLLSVCLLLSIEVEHTRQVFMSPVHLTGKWKSRSSKVSHLLRLTTLVELWGNDVRNKPSEQNSWMINYEPFDLSFWKTPHKAKNKHEIKIFLRSGVGPTAVDRFFWVFFLCMVVDVGWAQRKRRWPINAAIDGYFLFSLVGGRLTVKMIGLVLLTVLGAAGSTHRLHDFNDI